MIGDSWCLFCAAHVSRQARRCKCDIPMRADFFVALYSGVWSVRQWCPLLQLPVYQKNRMGSKAIVIFARSRHISDRNRCANVLNNEREAIRIQHKKKSETATDCHHSLRPSVSLPVRENIMRVWHMWVCANIYITTATSLAPHTAQQAHSPTSVRAFASRNRKETHKNDIKCKCKRHRRQQPKIKSNK